MSNNSQDNNNLSKDLTTQTLSSEPSINILSKLNTIANENFHQIIPSIVCEICYKANNLIICEICKNGFHKKCLNTAFLPEPFICFHCKNQFTEDEISSIIQNIYNQSHFQRKIILESQKIRDTNKKIKKKLNLNTIINPTKIIELNEDNENDNSNYNKIHCRSKDENDKNSNINLNKNNYNKKIIDINIVENMNGNNRDEKSDNNEKKSIRKENKNKTKSEFDKNSTICGGMDNDNYESSVMSKSQELIIDKYSFKNKKRKKDKDSNLNLKLKSNSQQSHFRSNSPNNNLINNPLNCNDIKSNKDKNNNKDEISHQTQIQSNKKNSKRRNYELRSETEQNLLSSLAHTDPQYKRRKIKIGANRQCNMYEFTDKYESKINFEEEEYERNDLVQVWSTINNPLTEEELNNYINTSRLFWNYKNIHIEEDLCADFFQECEKKMKNKKIQTKLKNKITKLIKELKELIKRGINLNSHYDEMSLRVLHLCKYKTNVALLFLYKGLNPFIEEIEEGFKHDIYFFQDEIYSFINNGDFFDSDN